MENTSRLPFAYQEGASPEKHAHLLQIIVVISSGILSSSAVATVVKAWLDSRKTTLAIQIDGNSKTLTYEGHHLNQDAAPLQALLEQLRADTNVAAPVDAVAIDLIDDGQNEEGVLEVGNHQEHTMHAGSEQAVAGEHLSLLKRLLPGWLHRELNTESKVQ